MNSPLIFERFTTGRFQIGSETLEVFRAHVQDTPYISESGGVLLGRHILSSNDVVLDEVTTPLPGDQKSRFKFFRARERHQEAINIAWHKSNGTCTYLGEWHTHPECKPTPSYIDRLNWYRKLMVDRFSNCVFFIIVGTEEIKVWEGLQGKPRIHELRRME